MTKIFSLLILSASFYYLLLKIKQIQELLLPLLIAVLFQNDCHEVQLINPVCLLLASVHMSQTIFVTHRTSPWLLVTLTAISQCGWIICAFCISGDFGEVWQVFMNCTFLGAGWSNLISQIRLNFLYGYCSNRWLLLLSAVAGEYSSI